MNYATQALEFLRNIVGAYAKNGAKLDSISITAVCDEVTTATKFLLPDNANVGMNTSQAVMNLIRVPYPCVVFEYNMRPNEVSGGEWQGVEGFDGKVLPSTKRLSVVWRISPSETQTSLARALVSAYPVLQNRIGALVASIYQSTFEGKDVWALSAAAAFVELGEQVTVKTTQRYSKGVATYKVDLVNLLPNTTDDIIERFGEVEADKCLANDVADEVTVAVQALACLNARNVHQVTVDAPHKLNKKRAKSNKVPFFEYKVLDIFLGKDRGITHRDRIASALRTICGCKLHGVRGHFKTRKSGIYWWSDFARGSKSNGVVNKDYHVV